MNIIINSKDMYVQIYFKGISKTEFSDKFFSISTSILVVCFYTDLPFSLFWRLILFLSLIML